MPDPTFMLEYEEQTWRVQDDTDHAIYLKRHHTGRVTIKPCPLPHNDFVFIDSDPNLVLAIGRLLVAAAKYAGAKDA